MNDDNDSRGDDDDDDDDGDVPCFDYSAGATTITKTMFMYAKAVKNALKPMTCSSKKAWDNYNMRTLWWTTPYSL